MNDELQKKLVEYLGSVEKMANDAVLFGKAEIPLYLQELIRWEMVMGALMACGGLFLIGAVFPFAIVTGLREGSKDYSKKSEAIIGLCVSACIASLALGIPSIIFGTRDAAKAYFAPRVLLVEKLSSMVRK